MSRAVLGTLSYFRILCRKFCESWTACLVMLSNGNLQAISSEHLIGAAKTGTFTGVSMVIAFLIFRNRSNKRYLKYYAILLTGLLAAIGEHIARITDNSAWPEGINIFKSILVGIGASFIALLTEYIATSMSKKI